MPRIIPAPVPYPIVARALFIAPVVDIGQLGGDEIFTLNLAVRLGVLAKAQAGPFPIPRTVYARPGFDFEQERVEALAGYRVAAARDRHRRERQAA